MKKILLPTALLTAASFSAPLMAEEVNEAPVVVSNYDTHFTPYFGFRTGASFTSTDIDCHHHDYDCELDDDTVFTVHPYVGINLPYSSTGLIGGRVELEGFFNSEGEYDFDSYSWEGGISRDKLKVKTNGFLVNTYLDFYLANGLVAPYVGIGLGGAWHKADLTSSYLGNDSDNNSDVAFQIGTGVNFNFTKNIGAEVNARYTYLGEVWSRTYIEKIELSSFDLMAGLRFTF